MYFQINWYVKKMNTSRPELNRISWTVVSLNWFLKLHKSFKLMVNKKVTTYAKVVDGMIPDSDKIYTLICVKLRTTRL